MSFDAYFKIRLHRSIKDLIECNTIVQGKIDTNQEEGRQVGNKVRQILTLETEIITNSFMGVVVEKFE